MNYEDRVTKEYLEAAIAGNIVFGTYTGDGAQTRTIELGFTPRAIFVCTEHGRVYMRDSSRNCDFMCGGLTFPDHPIRDPQKRVVMQIVDGGIEVHAYSYESGRNTHCTNEGSTVYHYAALL